MKTTLYSLLTAFLLVPLVSSVNPEFTGRFTKQKKIKKEFNVSANDLLKIENSYGNIDVTTWDKNQVVIEVVIQTNGNDEEKVQERLEEIEVAFNQTAGEVSAKTLFEKEESSWLSNLFGSSSNVNMEINYRIKAPATNNVSLVNDYGGISLDNLKGNANISADYGRILIGELHGENNILNFDYTRNSTIGFVKRAKINADYSEFVIDEAGTLDLSADYTESVIHKVENISFNNDYGSLKIDKLRNIKGQGDYLGVKLGGVYRSLDLNMDYGSLVVERIMGSLKEFDVESDYTSIKIGYDKSAPFSFEVATAYGGISGINDEGFTINTRNQSSGDNYYKGHYLSGNTGGRINIDSSYGSVTFTD